MKTTKIINIFFLIILSLFVISACADDSGNTYTSDIENNKVYVYYHYESSTEEFTESIQYALMYYFPITYNLYKTNSCSSASLLHSTTIYYSRMYNSNSKRLGSYYGCSENECIDIYIDYLKHDPYTNRYRENIDYYGETAIYSIVYMNNMSYISEDDNMYDWEFIPCDSTDYAEVYLATLLNEAFSEETAEEEKLEETTETMEETDNTEE